MYNHAVVQPEKEHDSIICQLLVQNYLRTLPPDNYKSFTVRRAAVLKIFNRRIGVFQDRFRRHTNTMCTKWSFVKQVQLDLLAK